MKKLSSVLVKVRLSEIQQRLSLSSVLMMVRLSEVQV